MVTVALTSNGQTIETTINKRQSVQLDCNMVFGEQTGIRNIQFFWRIADMPLMLGSAVRVVTPDGDVEYQCIARGFVGKQDTRTARGTVIITVRGTYYNNIP